MYLCKNKPTTIMNLTEEKQKNLILHFINKNGGSIDLLKLMKLIWMSDRIHLNKYGRLISQDSYYALPLGPVPSNIYDKSKKGNEFTKKTGYNISSTQMSIDDFFSKSDVEVMEYVWNKFNTKDGLPFSDYSHNFPEWKRFEKELNNFPSSYNIVIQDFFQFPDFSEFEDFLSKDEIEESKLFFNSTNSIQNFLNK